MSKFKITYPMKSMFTHLLALSILVLTGCASAEKHYNNGNYDLAIQKAVQKLRKKPNHLKTMIVLEDAFRAAQNRDLDRISLLKKEGSPENWNQIFNTYNGIKKRQDLVKPLPSIPNNIQFVAVEDDLVASKKNAAEYDYAKAVQLLNTNTRADAKTAYAHLQNVKNYYQSFKDTDALLQKARNQGTAYVLLTLKNKSGMIIPARFEQEILHVSLNDLNGGWTVFHTHEQAGIPYHYHAIFDLNQLSMSPEQIKESSFEETKEIEGGWKYELDANGNVKKDSTGKDIKVKKYTTIRCRIIETYQLKTARVSGNLSIYSLETKQLLKSDPVTSDAIFEHRSGTVVGDKRALSKRGSDLIRNRPVPFPSDADIILTGTDRLKGIIKGILDQHRGLFQ